MLNRKKQKGEIGAILALIYLCFVIAFVYGWVVNIYDICTQYPRIQDWEAKHVVCTAGVFVGPVGAVCGYIDVH